MLLSVCGGVNRSYIEGPFPAGIVKAKGIFHELKGTIKGKTGKLTNNRGLVAKGLVEKIAGKIQKKIGQVERAFEKS